MGSELKSDAGAHNDRVTSGSPKEQQPIPDTQLNAASERYRSYPKPSELQPVNSRKVVLVVEDDLQMLGFLQDVLRTENYELFATDKPQEALELVDRGIVPDLLITDVHMPNMSGVELSQKFRSVIPTLPVLFETGHTARLFHKCPELDANTAFIEKPFSARGLIEAARLVLFGTFNPG
jgi:CheY-like chemotaxis protein